MLLSLQPPYSLVSLDDFEEERAPRARQPAAGRTMEERVHELELMNPVGRCMLDPSLKAPLISNFDCEKG